MINDIALILLNIEETIQWYWLFRETCEGEKNNCQLYMGICREEDLWCKRQ